MQLEVGGGDRIDLLLTNEQLDQGLQTGWNTFGVYNDDTVELQVYLSCEKMLTWHIISVGFVVTMVLDKWETDMMGRICINGQKYKQEKKQGKWYPDKLTSLCIYDGKLRYVSCKRLHNVKGLYLEGQCIATYRDPPIFDALIFNKPF